MNGTLYIVGTPIGNLGDISARCRQILEQVDFIAAEDTRVTVKLLNHIGIKKPMFSYHEHNLKERGEYLLSKIQAGENCALCSDAGMPCISDPGEIIVRDAHAKGITVVPIPSATAATTALAVSGLQTGRFCFEGFIPMNKNQRKDRLKEIEDETRTMIFYEAPHKLNATLADLKKTFGGERKLTLARELTKLHEDIFVTTIDGAIEFYTESNPRGEYVLVLEGGEKKVEEQEEISIETATEMAISLMEQGKPASGACKEISAITPYSKSEIYKMVNLQNNAKEI